MDHKVNEPARATSPSSSPRFDPLALATLVGVVVMLTVSLWNLWSLNGLGERVAAIEARVGRARASGPEPGRVYTVKTAGAQTKGPTSAPVTIVEFSDFQCPFCARAVPTLRQIQETYGANVRIVWKHLPLPIHKEAVGAALAAEAAGKQGRFWEFHDKLFASQDRLGADDLKHYARELQLDMNRFESDLVNADDQKRINEDVTEAIALGVSGTPGFFINGRFIDGAQPFKSFSVLIDQELVRLAIPIPSKPSSN